MFADVEEDVYVAFEAKVKAHVFGDARLPDARAFIILFGAERWMADILKKKVYLLFESILNLFREFFELTVKRFCSRTPHFRRCAMSSSVVLNGPDTLPSSASRKLACSQRGSFFFDFVTKARGRTGADSSNLIFASSTRTRFSKVAVVMRSLYHFGQNL